MKVLVADDDVDVRETIAEYLRLHKFDVLEAANGLETLLHVKRERPAAIVLDLRMPRLGGIEALKRIRAFDPAISVVVLTAETEPEVLKQAHAFGAHAVLAKPVNLASLAAALRRETGSDADAPDRAAATATSTAPIDIMVVDDDPALREMLTEFLTHRGYRVSTVADAATAIRKIVDAAPDVMLLDIDMPGLTGTGALPTIRAVAPRTAVIMVSGTTDDQVAKSALALGAFDYVVKPVSFDYLIQSLETLRAMKSL